MKKHIPLHICHLRMFSFCFVEMMNSCSVYNSSVPRLELSICNTLGVCHSLSSGFELKHDRLSRDDDGKVNLRR
jgi:hypothetical protein